MRKTLVGLAVALLATLGSFSPAATPVVNAAANVKVAIIVGATHDATAKYRSYADQIYSDAIKYTSNVVRVYSPNATASKVQAAVAGASIIVYLGHGNGWPSRYRDELFPPTQNGFGLNPVAGIDNSTHHTATLRNEKRVAAPASRSPKRWGSAIIHRLSAKRAPPPR